MSTVRRGRSYCDADPTDVDSSNPVMQGQAVSGHLESIREIRSNARSASGPWRLRIQVVHPASDVVVAHHTEERGDRAVRPARVAAIRDGPRSGSSARALSRSRAAELAIQYMRRPNWP